MVQFISLIDFLFSYGLNCRNKCEIASMSYFCFPTGLLDKAVDLCYRPQPFVNELNRIEYLFSLYEALSAPLLKVEKKKWTKKSES
jgi:hypothetical protein